MSASVNGPRIMILRAELLNVLPREDLGQTGRGCCTYCCTPVEVSVQLARLIAAWPSLKDEQKRGLEILLTVSARDDRDTDQESTGN